MSQATLLSVTTFAGAITLAVVIASLVLNIVTLSKVNDLKTDSDCSPSIVTTTPALPSPSTGPLPPSNPKFADAGKFLLQGINFTIDPCQDFYAFTCGKYIADHHTGNNVNRIGTYDEGQTAVNQGIYNTLKTKGDKSKTAQITLQAAQRCVDYYSSKTAEDKSQNIYNDLKTLFTTVPFVDGAYTDLASDKFFKYVGQIEQEHALGTLFSTLTTVNYKNIATNGIFVGQPLLALPRDFFVKPQFLDKVLSHVDDVYELLALFAKRVKSKTREEELLQAAKDIVNFEISIATASWPDTQMRNYKQQYNPYTAATLKNAFKSIDIGSYAQGLMTWDKIPHLKDTDTIILTQPSYFSWLDSVFEGGLVQQKTIVNYIAWLFIADNGDFLGDDAVAITRRMGYVEHFRLRGRGLRRIGAKPAPTKTDLPDDVCIGILSDLMPYGTGYIYAKYREDREPALTDVETQTGLVIESFRQMIKSLKWIDQKGIDSANKKADNLIKNYGYPHKLFGKFGADDDFRVDKYHTDYEGIIQQNDWYDIMKSLKKGMEIREFFKIMNDDECKDYWEDKRHNFLASPATVNAWYQPERNSITFPLAVLNEPYYRLSFPQAFNYGGQGGTGGHELTHGYDDEGVQFGPDGMLSDCDDFHCGWMDAKSTTGFIDMAQCVVSQYNTQCCPLSTGNVHCANGETTQGENIADLGGQQAAYLAYRKYVAQNLKGVEELRVPGLENYTPNQIFWITYGYSWCMVQEEANLVNQMLTNPHAPASCRTNQVMQDIPEFAADFNCPLGSSMRPTQRCKVWVGN